MATRGGVSALSVVWIRTLFGVAVGQVTRRAAKWRRVESRVYPFSPMLMNLNKTRNRQLYQVSTHQISQ